MGDLSDATPLFKYRLSGCEIQPSLACKFDWKCLKDMQGTEPR